MNQRKANDGTPNNALILVRQTTGRRAFKPMFIHSLDTLFFIALN